MSTRSTFSTGTGGAIDNKSSHADRHSDSKDCCCDIDIHIDCRGDVNIYNCSTPSGTGATPTPTCPLCFPPVGACLPAVPGAKHKLSSDYKLTQLANSILVPSSLAAGAIHMARRFLLGKAAANALEASVFATLGQMSRDILACWVAAFDAMPVRQVNRLLAQSLVLDPDNPIDEGILTAALAQEIKQRISVEVFGDPQGGDQERPGRMRVYVPQGEDFFSQVRICSINELRTANFIPPINIGDYLPAEIQQDCSPQIVNGQAEVVCQVRTANCPGNTIGSAVCARVLDIAQGDGVVLKGVNYFSVDAKVRFSDKQTGNAVRDVDAHVFGDLDTPVTEEVNGQTVLINDCRVHDQLTFQVPVDLAPNNYQIQVIVPNITGNSVFGPELVSNAEFITVIVPATARFQIVTETINCREETSPAWIGSDEVGLHTLAFPLDLNLQPIVPVQEEKFTDIQDVDFDSGTHRDITRIVFRHDQPILALVMSVMGYEIDSQRAYDQQITSQTDFFIDIVKKEAVFIGAALAALGGISALTSLGPIGAIVAGIALLVTVGVDIIIARWAPADLIIQDSIGLTITDLAKLTSANEPAPDPTTFTTEDGIVVNVNKTIPPRKLPLEYHETREYVCDSQDSRYELTYRFNRIA
jgi:hypothetical protein